MAEVYFYKDSGKSDDAAAKLLGVIEAAADAESTKIKNASPGVYALKSCFYAVPEEAARRLQVYKEYDLGLPQNCITRIIEASTGCKTFLIDVEGECGSDEYFAAAAGEPGVNTFQFLCNVLAMLGNDSQSEAPGFIARGMKTMMSVFERTGRLYECCDAGFRPAVERYVLPYNYAIFSLCMEKMHEASGGAQYLSTALKGVDTISGLAECVEGADPALSALAAIFLGKYLLKRFYDDRGFRLPVN